MSTPEVGPIGEQSDGFHTFNELYAHRRALTAALTSCLPEIAWKSKLHDDGTMLDGFFIVGIDLPEIGTVSYHYALDYWDEFAHVPYEARAPKWDGHTPADVVERLTAWSRTAKPA